MMVVLIILCIYIREVTGTVFDEAFPNNECEGVFKAKEGYFKNIEEARVLLLSIGMTQSYD